MLTFIIVVLILAAILRPRRHRGFGPHHRGPFFGPGMGGPMGPRGSHPMGGPHGPMFGGPMDHGHGPGCGGRRGPGGPFGPGPGRW